MIASMRSKRVRDYDSPCAETGAEDEFVSSFANKRMCTEPALDTTPLNTMISENQMDHPEEIQVDERDEDSMSNDMDVNDDIVSNFNTISFDAANIQQDSVHDNKKSPPSYPVFPPLQRAGRKIDHLVDDVIRKSSRINPEQLQISIPPSRGDIEFHMPAYVCVGGGPTRDARFLTSPEARQLAATRQATSSVVARDHIDMSSPGNLSNLSNLSTPRFSRQVEHGVRSSTSRQSHIHGSPHSLSSPPPFHLGNVTHSDWFEGSCSSGNEEHAGERRRSVNNVGTPHGGACSSHEDSSCDNDNDEDEDCEDMYVDA